MTQRPSHQGRSAGAARGRRLAEAFWRAMVLVGRATERAVATLRDGRTPTARAAALLRRVRAIETPAWARSPRTGDRSLHPRDAAILALALCAALAPALAPHLSPEATRFLTRYNPFAERAHIRAERSVVVAPPSAPTLWRGDAVARAERAAPPVWVSAATPESRPLGALEALTQPPVVIEVAPAPIWSRYIAGLEESRSGGVLARLASGDASAASRRTLLPDTLLAGLPGVGPTAIDVVLSAVEITRPSTGAAPVSTLFDALAPRAEPAPTAEPSPAPAPQSATEPPASPGGADALLSVDFGGATTEPAADGGGDVEDAGEETLASTATPTEAAATPTEAAETPSEAAETPAFTTAVAPRMRPRTARAIAEADLAGRAFLAAVRERRLTPGAPLRVEITAADLAAASAATAGIETATTPPAAAIEPAATPETPPAAPLGAVETPRITVILTAVGINKEATALAAALLPREVAFALPPITADAPRIAEAAIAAGRKVLLEAPLQPASYPRVNPGAMTLLVEAAAEENAARLADGLAKTPGATGVATYLGDAFLRDARSTRDFALELKRRGLFVVETEAAEGSSLAAAASDEGVAYAGGVVSIDDAGHATDLSAGLGRLEALARRTGHAVATAVAIPSTVTALGAWAETLAARGFRLEPIRPKRGPLAPGRMVEAQLE